MQACSKVPRSFPCSTSLHIAHSKKLEAAYRSSKTYLAKDGGERSAPIQSWTHVRAPKGTKQISLGDTHRNNYVTDKLRLISSLAAKGKNIKVYEDLYSAPIVRTSPLKSSGMDHTVFTLQIRHTSRYLVSVHQTAQPLDNGSSHLITAYYSFYQLREDERLSWLTYSGRFTHECLPISCRSDVGQGKFVGWRQTFCY